MVISSTRRKFRLFIARNAYIYIVQFIVDVTVEANASLRYDKVRACLIVTQSRCQSPRSSVGGIVGLWENAEENQPLIGCLIISLTHSLLGNACNFNYSRSKIQTCLLNSAFYSLINITPTQCRTMHSKAQYKLHNRKIYAQKNYTMQITCKHLTIYVHNKYFNWLAPI